MAFAFEDGCFVVLSLLARIKAEAMARKELEDEGI